MCTRRAHPTTYNGGGGTGPITTSPSLPPSPTNTLAQPALAPVLPPALAQVVQPVPHPGGFEMNK